MSSIHDTIGSLDNTRTPSADDTIARLAQIASILKESEQFISSLGIGDVVFTRLPNSVYVDILWREDIGDGKDIRVIIANVKQVSAIANQAQAILNKYLRPVLVEDYQWLEIS